MRSPARSSRVPSGGEPGLFVEPMPNSAPVLTPLRRIVLAAAVGATLLVVLDRVLTPPDTHLGPARVLFAGLRSLFPRGLPLPGFFVVVVHFLLCLLYAALMTPIVARLRSIYAAIAGAGCGALLYAIHYYALTPLLPWLVGGRDSFNFLGHLAFGVVVAVLLRPPHWRASSPSLT